MYLKLMDNGQSYDNEMMYWSVKNRLEEMEDTCLA